MWWSRQEECRTLFARQSEPVRISWWNSFKRSSLTSRMTMSWQRGSSRPKNCRLSRDSPSNGEKSLFVVDLVTRAPALMWILRRWRKLPSPLHRD